MWESLYQQINLLFIDELVDAGMDISGVESAMAVLKDMSRTQQKNIFLISHKDELISRVDSVLKVVKDKETKDVYSIGPMLGKIKSISQHH